MTDDTTIYHMMGRVEGKVDAFLASQARHEKTLDDHDKRLSSLEQAKAQGTGLTKAVSIGWIVAASTIGVFAEQIRMFFLK